MAKKDDDFDMKELVDAAFDIASGEYDDTDEDAEEESPKSSKKSSKKEDADDEDVGGAFATDPLETDDPKWRGTRYWQVTGGNRYISMNFSKYFGKEAEDYEDFVTSCGQKKAYSKMSYMFCNTANVILNKNKQTAETFMYKYYCIKRNINHRAYDPSSDQFANAIINLFDKDIVNELRNYVNSKYHETGDSKWEANKRTFIPAITFLDRHIKVLFVVSRMIHLAAPLCIEYIHEYDMDKTSTYRIEAKTFLAEIFSNLFPIAEEVSPELVKLSKTEQVKADVYNKLYSFVESKVKDTLQSDEPMWERQAFLAVNYKTTIDAILNKLIVDIVPEYAFIGNVMHMNVAVVRKSIQDYTLRRKDPFSINMLVDADNNTSDDDNAVVSESEQFDSYNAKHDEFSIVIRHTFAEHTVNTIISRKGVVIEQSEIDWYMEHIRFHEFQTFVIFSAVTNAFGGTENVYSLNKELYVKLMLCIVKVMEVSGLGSLAKYVTATKNRHYISRKETRLSRNALLNDPMYQYIVENKYSGVKNIIDKKNNFLESIISKISNNEYVYNTPNPDLNGRIIPRDDVQIRKDILKFISSFVF